jgi:hypothetical protein
MWRLASGHCLLHGPFHYTPVIFDLTLGQAWLLAAVLGASVQPKIRGY